MSEPDMPEITMPQCEVCENEISVGVACVPGIPISVAYGRKCLEEGAAPFPLLKANVECCGGVDAIIPEYLESRTYLNGRYMSLKEALEISPIDMEEVRRQEQAFEEEMRKAEEKYREEALEEALRKQEE